MHTTQYLSHPSPPTARIADDEIHQWGDTLEAQIGLFGRIQFRRMDLFYVDGMLLLLNACTETLEALRLHLTTLVVSNVVQKVWKFQPKIPQLEYLFRALVYCGIGRFGRLNLRQRLLIVYRMAVHKIPPQVSSDVLSRPLYPPRSLRSWSFTTTTTSAVYKVHGVDPDRGAVPGVLYRGVSQTDRAGEASRHHM